MRPTVHRPLLLALNLLAILDCGSSKGTTTTDTGSTGGTSAAGAGGVETGGAQAGANGTGGVAGVAGAGAGAAGTGGNTGGAGTGTAGVGGTITCGQTSVPLQPIAPDILILLDNSLSMNDDVTGNRCVTAGCSKWSQVLAGIEDVVMTTQATVNWGLKFMDADSTCGVPTGVAVDVGPGGYTAISAALAAALPIGDTPTELAINSAVAYLQSRTDPNSKYILLATDGLPNCTPGDTRVTDDDSPGTEAALEAARTAGFDTFVIGIATSDPMSTAILNAMAIAGGVPQPAGSDTSYYIANDTATLEASLTTIAANATPCAFALPPAPAGSTLAISAATSGGSVTIAKDAANGWAYAVDMKSVALEGTACASVQSGSYTSIVASYLCSQ
jgi:hypothetical protein